MKKELFTLPVFINAVLFQVLWLACAFGAAKQLIWPSCLALVVLMVWQLHPKRRHNSDVTLMLLAVILGLIIDSLWVYLGLMKFELALPWEVIAPFWIILLWIGFALTVNHSMMWLKNKWYLPIAMGMIGAPIAYLAGQKFGALTFTASTPVVALSLGAAWAIALTMMIKVSER